MTGRETERRPPTAIWELYEYILALQTASQSAQLDFYKNEALEYLNRQASGTAAGKKRLAQALQREHLEGIAPREMSLRWQFFNIQELEPEEDDQQPAGAGIEAFAADPGILPGR